MNKCILFFDIDDTLTSEIDGEVPESALSAILDLQKRGHKIFINTGRCLQTVAEKIREIPFDGYICGCGTAIYDGEGKAIWHYSSDCGGKAEQFSMEYLRKLALDFGADILLEGPDAMAMLAGNDVLAEGAAFHWQDYKERGYRLLEADDPVFSYDKFTVWFKSRENMFAFMEKTGSLYTGIDRGESHGGPFGEFVPRGYTKATGIRTVCKLYNIPEESCFVFGDSNNDLPMFESKATKVAMGNCNSAQLLARADYVTAKASEDGIAKALQQYF